MRRQNNTEEQGKKEIEIEIDMDKYDTPLDIFHSSLYGVAIVLCISIAFNIKVTLLSVLLGVLLGGLSNAFINIIAIRLSRRDMEFNHQIHNMICRGIDKNVERINELEKRIEQLENEGRH